MKIKDKISRVGVISKRELSATVIRACTNCGAPGFYHDVVGVNVGCYDPKRKGQSVGPVCPCCQAARPADEDRGVIWSEKRTLWGEAWRHAKSLFAST